MHTVPLRPGGAGHRANRIETPSGVFTLPVTAPSGTGLAGTEISVMGRLLPWIGAVGRDCRDLAKAHDSMPTPARTSPLTGIAASCSTELGGAAAANRRAPQDIATALLKPHTSLPICSLRRPTGCADRSGPSGGPLHVASRRICHAYIRPLPAVPFDRRFRPAVFDAGQFGRFEGGGSPYPPYNIERTGENAYRVTIAVAGFADPSCRSRRRKIP